MNLVILVFFSLIGLSLAGVLSSNEYPFEQENSSGEYDQNEEGPVKIIKITRTYAVPVPVPVPFAKEVPVPIPVHKVYPYPVPVPVHKQVLVPHPVAVAIPVHIGESNQQYYVASNNAANYGGAVDENHVQYNQLTQSQVVHHDS